MANNPLNWIRILLILSLLGYGYGVFVRPASTPIGAKRLRQFGVLIAFLACLSFPNFGYFHRPDYGAVQYWDAFHYFMGSKYLPELGYSRLYEATLVSGREHNVFGDITQVRDLTTYQPKDVAAINSAEIKSHFTPERWNEFATDLSFFVGVVKQWPELFADHGYNDPPFRAVLLGMLTNRITAGTISLHLLTLIDYLLIALAFWGVFRVLGHTAGIVAVTFFMLNFLARFNFVGGSIMRWDWIAAIIFAACELAAGRAFRSGLALAYATGARIFPVLLLVPLLLKWVFEIVRSHGPHPLTPLVRGFGVGLVVIFAITLIGIPHISLIPEFAEKISAHGKSPFLNHIGLAQVVTFSIVPWIQSPEVGLHVPKEAAMAARANYWFGPFLAAVALLFMIRPILRRTSLEAFPYGTILIFLLMTPANYYYSFLVLFILAPFTEKGIHKIDLIKIGMLLAITLSSYLFEQQSAEMLPLYYKVSIQIGIFLSLSLLLDFVRTLRPDIKEDYRLIPDLTPRGV